MNETKDSPLAKIICILVFLFLAAPLIIVVMSSFSETALLSFPPSSFSLKWYANIFNSNGFETAFLNSVVLAGCATAFDVVVGVAAALFAAKYSFRGKNAFISFLTSPMFLPGIAFGFVLLQVFGAIRVIPIFWKLFIGHIVIILPYIIRNVSSVFVGYDWTLEEAAMSLGANLWQTFRKVTFPLIKPGILAGALLSFLFSFDDATLAAFLTGPKFLTLPIRMLAYMEFAFDPTLAAISTLQIAISLILILLMDRFAGLDVFLK